MKLLSEFEFQRSREISPTLTRMQYNEIILLENLHKTNN